MPLPFESNTSSRALLAIVTVALLITKAPTEAALVVLPKAALSTPIVPESSIVRFNEIAISSAINGRTIDGFTFTENIPNAITSNTGPGTTTGNVDAPYLLSQPAFSPATYVLTINMPGAVNGFGFGFAILDTIPRANALTITLFDGLTNLGSLTYASAPDPTFDGGYAGIGSDIRFNRAQVTFGPTAVAFAMDDVAAIPEPATLLFGLTLAGVCASRRQRSRAVAVRV